MFSSQKSKDNIFLATTALEDFWDKSKKIVYLGPWCFKYSEGKNYNNAPESIWSSSLAENAYDNVELIYKSFILSLSDALNEIHGVAHSKRYWEITVGPWLFLFISMLYDRYWNIKRIESEERHFSTICLSDESFMSIYDTKDFSVFADTDEYNLQIFSKIFRELGFDFIKRPILKTPSLPSDKSAIGLGRKIYSIFFAYMLEKLCPHPPVVIRQSSFSGFVKLLLSLKSKGKIRFADFPRMQRQSFKKNELLREKFFKYKYSQETEFEMIVWKLISEEIPLCFLEGYSQIVEQAYQRFNFSPKLILSSFGWYFDEDFKFWAAAASERGISLAGAQHGGYYGVLKKWFNESHEISITDFYYTWGWKSVTYNAKTIPFPSQKLINYPDLSDVKKKSGILYVLTKSPRYLSKFDLTPNVFQVSLDWQMEFIRSLSPSIFNLLTVRVHAEDCGWSISQRLKDNFPIISLDLSNRDFLDSLKKTRLYVTDHCSTTFLEALACNKPTILFWSQRVNNFREDAIPYFDLLRSHDILLDSPEMAAEIVEKNYVDIERWWNQPSRQKAVKEFCDRFAKSSSDYGEIWLNELISRCEIL